MQFTIGSRPGNWGKGVRVSYVAAIGGLAALAAAIAFTGFDSTDHPASTVDPPAPPVTVNAAGPDQLLVYIVGTEAERRALEQDVAASPEWFAETYAGKETQVRILVLDRNGEESLDTLARLIPEASIVTGMGPAIKLVDIR